MKIASWPDFKGGISFNHTLTVLVLCLSLGTQSLI